MSYQGSIFKQISPQIASGCISPEASELLDEIMDAWNEHLVKLREIMGPEYEPTYYGFAYWLVRWSGLIQPIREE